MSACQDLALVLLVLMPAMAASNNLALLSGTLRTFQVASCDGDELRLQCPPSTVVVIRLAHYGRLAAKPDLCGHPADMQRVNNTDCMDRNALKVVINKCGGKQSCRLQTSPKAFGIDPCPGIAKFVEVLYKCRPIEFRSRVVCQGDRLKIDCDDAKIAIYSAKFGVTKHGSMECPQREGVSISDCLASFASEKMINLCQGRSSCDLVASPAVFGQPCPAGHNMYLKYTYTCVPRKILREKYDQDDPVRQQNTTEAPVANRHTPQPGRDAPSTPRNGKIVPLSDGVQGDYSPPPPPPPPLPPLDDCNCTQPMTDGQRHVIGFITEWITAYRYVSDNKEKFILYLTLSVTGGLLLCLLAVIGRLYCQRRRARQEVKAHYIDPPPHGFTDDLSEVDADIDLGTVLSPGRLSPGYGAQLSFNGSLREPAEPSRYGSSGRGTLRALGDDTNPRSLAHAPNVFYYS